MNATCEAHHLNTLSLTFAKKKNVAAHEEEVGISKLKTTKLRHTEVNSVYELILLALANLEFMFISASDYYIGFYLVYQTASSSLFYSLL